MKRKFMWRLTNGESVTDVMTREQMLNALKQNPTWIPQRVLVYS